MSTDFKVQRLRLLSGSENALVVPIDAGAPPTLPAGTIGITSAGAIYKSAGAGSWSEIADTPTLSGTINAAFLSTCGLATGDGIPKQHHLSGSIDGHFNQLSGTINARFASFQTGVTGTIGIVSGTQLPVTASLEGNIDWYIANAFQSPPRGIAASSMNSKRGGGWIKDGFDWVCAGNTFSTDTASAGQPVSSVATDTIAASAVNATTVKARMFHLSSPTNGWGFELRVPALTGSRVLRVAASHFSSVVAFSASLTDGSAAPVSVVCSSGASALNSTLITVLYNARNPCELLFTATTVARYTVDPNIQFGWATLSGSNL